MSTEQVTIIVAIIINIIATYLIYYKGYREKKGENLAIKEDIGEITKIVENIKYQLDYHTQAKIAHYSEERNILISCFSDMLQFIDVDLDPSFFKGKLEDEGEWEKHFILLENNKKKLKNSLSRLLLFGETDYLYNRYMMLLNHYDDHIFPLLSQLYIDIKDANNMPLDSQELHDEYLKVVNRDVDSYKTKMTELKEGIIWEDINSIRIVTKTRLSEIRSIKV